MIIPKSFKDRVGLFLTKNENNPYNNLFVGRILNKNEGTLSFHLLMEIPTWDIISSLEDVNESILEDLKDSRYYTSSSYGYCEIKENEIIDSCILLPLSGRIHQEIYCRFDDRMRENERYRKTKEEERKRIGLECEAGKSKILNRLFNWRKKCQ